MNTLLQSFRKYLAKIIMKREIERMAKTDSELRSELRAQVEANKRKEKLMAEQQAEVLNFVDNVKKAQSKDNAELAKHKEFISSICSFIEEVLACYGDDPVMKRLVDKYEIEKSGGNNVIH